MENVENLALNRYLPKIRGADSLCKKLDFFSLVCLRYRGMPWISQCLMSAARPVTREQKSHRSGTGTLVKESADGARDNCADIRKERPYWGSR